MNDAGLPPTPPTTSSPPRRIKPLWDRDVDWQRTLYVPLTILAWLAVAVVIVWLMGHVVKTILTLVLATVIAFALTPLVGRLERSMPRALAITIAYVLGFGILIALIALLVTTVAGQVNTLVLNLPEYSRQITRYEPQLLSLLRPFGVTQGSLHRAEAATVTYLQGAGTAAARDSLGILTGVLGTIVNVVLVLILSVYLTANGPNIAEALRRETPDRQERTIDRAITEVNRVIGGYVRGTLTLATLIGLLVGIGMALLGVKYAVLLGVLAFFMEFVPVVGVLVSGAVCVAIALFQGWLLAVIVLVYFAVVHVIEGDVVGPRIMGDAVGIHPATALLALVAGTELFGLWGALFGAPLAGLIQAVLVAGWSQIRGGVHPETVAEAVGEAVDNEVEGKTGVG